jgi:hypothetical protein
MRRWLHWSSLPLRLVWACNPRLVDDSQYRGDGLYLTCTELVFEPVVQRYAFDECDAVTIQLSDQADVLFNLCTTILLLCHINEEDDSRLPLASPRPNVCTFIDAPYTSAALFLIPHKRVYDDGHCRLSWPRHSDSDSDVNSPQYSVNYAPINERHRHQQHVITHLLLNHYATAQHGLSIAGDHHHHHHLTPLQCDIRRHCERCLLPCIIDHLDQHVRPDLTRLWLPLWQ